MEIQHKKMRNRFKITIWNTDLSKNSWTLTAVKVVVCVTVKVSKPYQGNTRQGLIFCTDKIISCSQALNTNSEFQYSFCSLVVSWISSISNGKPTVWEDSIDSGILTMWFDSLQRKKFLPDKPHCFLCLFQKERTFTPSSIFPALTWLSFLKYTFLETSKLSALSNWWA